MKIDGVFSGGGIKAFVFIGALKALEEEGYSFERVAGTSAGALFASLIVAGFQSDELEEIFLSLEVDQFLDQSSIGKYFPFVKWITLFSTMGLYKGKRFEKWVAALLEEKGIHSFGDIESDRLKIIAADITLNKVVVFPDDLKSNYHIEPSYFPISRAIRSSVSIPYFFRPTRLSNLLSRKISVIVDGMILSNFPLWIFEQDKKRPILGMQLTDPSILSKNVRIDNSVDLLKAMIGTMRRASDQKYISKNIANQILFFPINNVSGTDFNISVEKKKELIATGYNRTKLHLKTFRKNRA
ncbi:patatin-like phospholipase family protein [Gracilibacillus marinus]|jgi:NTE family protein|uniref:Patatin-like phospholipase family protein n=1 Tax=Gracilibacillus marinus TaxID=630535 RepID=A0ABV8VVL0_9BACI